MYYKSQVYEELIVSNNYWGNEFNPETDLYPYNFYTYLPIWELNAGSGGGEGAEALYGSAQEKIAQEDYSGAKVYLQLIVEDYSTSIYSQAALRELLSLEKIDGNDYVGLKLYYTTNSAIINNPTLDKLANCLANYCDIELENYSTAIAWFENIILDPETTEDYIFALIDLGYTYLRMENGGQKSQYAGTLTEHIPISFDQHRNRRDYLLSLISGEAVNEMNGNITGLNDGNLLQNIPNPFSGITQIWYKLESEATIQLNVYNYIGQLVSTIDGGTKSKGTHHIDFNATGLKNGIYFYSININGQTTDTKKMTIMK